MFAACVDDQIGAQLSVVDRVHIGGDGAKAVGMGCVERARHSLYRGVDVVAFSHGDLEAAVLQQHCRKDPVPTAQNHDPLIGFSCCLQQRIARPDLAGDLLVVEGVGDIGAGMLGDHLGDAVDQRAFGVGGNSACQVEGIFVPVARRSRGVAGVFHAVVVSWQAIECNKGAILPSHPFHLVP
ncbi:hypothetical protein D3C87_1516500 [compost metagenome]